MSWFQRFLCPLCSHQRNVFILNYSYTFSLWNTNDFSYYPSGNLSRSPPPPVCVQRGMLSHSFPFVRQITPHPSVYLSLSVMAETPHSQRRWPDWPLSLCRYRWPVAHIYLLLISRPPREAANSTLHNEGGGSKGWGWGERGDRKGGKTRVGGEVRGQRGGMDEDKVGRNGVRWRTREGREREKKSRWVTEIKGWKKKMGRGRSKDGKRGWVAE